MNKKIIAIICAIVVVAGLVIALCVMNCGGSAANLTLETTEDYTALIEKIYDTSKLEMFGLESREILLDDEYAIPVYTGLETAEGLEKVVVSECMITSSAYSLTMVKVADKSQVETIKKQMVDNIDMRRWICVGADVVYATNSGDVIFLVMSDEETAKQQLDAFKEVVGGKFGKELVRQAEVIDF